MVRVEESEEGSGRSGPHLQRGTWDCLPSDSEAAQWMASQVIPELAC
jgi:hypothetical protein